jgi:hypothetical protein
VKLLPFLREDVRPPEGREQVRIPKDVNFFQKAPEVKLSEGRATFGRSSERAFFASFGKWGTYVFQRKVGERRYSKAVASLRKLWASS